MSKPSARKDKVPKITEEEYVAYLTSLRESQGGEEISHTAEDGAQSGHRENEE